MSDKKVSPIIVLMKKNVVMYINILFNIFF